MIRTWLLEFRNIHVTFIAYTINICIYIYIANDKNYKEQPFLLLISFFGKKYKLIGCNHG